MIILHIGMPKCGSSTIQNFLRSNEDALQRISIDYPRIGRKPPENKAHHNIAYEIQPGYRDRFDSESGTVAELVGHIARRAAKTTVLSSEMFKNAQIDGIATLRAALLAVQPAAQFSILMIIRDLPEFLRSRYFRMVKHGTHVFDFDEFYARTSENLVTDYFELGQRWAGVFGWSAMEIRVLDRRYLLNGDLLDDFLALLGPQIPMGKEEGPERTSSRNVSPGWKTVEAVRALYSGAHILRRDHPLVVASRNSSHKRIGEAARRVGDQHGWNEDKGVYLNKQQFEFCSSTYCEAINSFNRFLTRQLPLPEANTTKAYRDSASPPSAEMIPRAELEEFYEELWRRILKRQKAETA